MPDVFISIPKPNNDADTKLLCQSSQHVFINPILSRGSQVATSREILDACTLGRSLLRILGPLVNKIFNVFGCERQQVRAVWRLRAGLPQRREFSLGSQPGL